MGEPVDPFVSELQQWLGVVSPVANVGGLSILVFALLTDRLLTRAQSARAVAAAVAAHEAEVANLKAYHAQALSDLREHHAAVRATDAARFEDMKTSRDYHAAAHDVDRARADGLSRELSTLAIEAAALAGQTVDAAEQAAREVAQDARQQQ